MKNTRYAVLLGALLLSGACGGSEAPLGAEPPFPGSATSMEHLGRGVLRALTVGDTVALERVRLTGAEHNEVVWPELPVSAPELNYPAGFAWETIQMRNARDLKRILPWFRSRDLEYRGVKCRGAIEVFRTFEVHTDCYMVFDSAEHGRLEAQVFKDILVRNGGYKIFRYYHERPRASEGG